LAFELETIIGESAIFEPTFGGLLSPQLHVMTSCVVTQPRGRKVLVQKSKPVSGSVEFGCLARRSSPLPSGNQTWQWEIPIQMEVLMGKSSTNGGFSIFRCYVWLPERRPFINIVYRSLTIFKELRRRKYGAEELNYLWLLQKVFETWMVILEMWVIVGLSKIEDSFSSTCQ
jgi:hypothetical protein